MRRRLAVALVLWAAAAQAQAVVADLPTPLGAEQAAFLPARGARATVVLLAGGSGIVAIGPGGETANQNFLIRTRAMWAAYGIAAAILGSPGNASLLGRRATLPSVLPGRAPTCRSGWSARARARSPP